jgi:hypothetical protein
MEALIVGFREKYHQAVVDALPHLQAYRVVFTDAMLMPLGPEVAVVVMSAANCEMGILQSLFTDKPGLKVYAQLFEKTFLMVEMAVSPVKRDEILSRAAIVKDVSLKLRHDVRSPIQTIHDCSERLHLQLVENDVAAALATVGVLQKSASKIYRGIARFGEFHSEVEKLIEQLKGMQGTDHADRGSK